MLSMAERLQKVSPAVFALGIVLFFMPFVSISCQGHKLVSLTGIQLSLGGEIKSPGMFGPTGQVRRTEPDFWATMALASLGTGLVLILHKQLKTTLPPAIAAGICAFSVLALKAKAENEVAAQGLGLQLSFDPAFWLVLLLSVALAALHGIAYVEQRRQLIAPFAGVPVTASPPTPPLVFCAACGHALAGNGATFCTNCGAPRGKAGNWVPPASQVWNCPVCRAPVVRTNDPFCRNCGTKMMWPT